jgi:hypothetical protein
MGSARWFRLGIGLFLVAGAAWILLSDLDPIWNGHPAYPTILLITLAVGLVVVAFVFFPWQLDPEPQGPPWEVAGKAEEATKGTNRVRGTRTSRRGWRIARRSTVVVLALILIGALTWLRPFGAGSEALAAMNSNESVTVIDKATSIELVPAKPATVGLVFSPGARVDARAYAALLHPVAEAGYLVVILKEPLGLAVLGPGQAEGPMADHPEITGWAVGGHSLGGVVASGFAADHPGNVGGLLLWASYPSQDLSADDTLLGASIYGSNDLLTTPAAIEQSKSNLPPATTFSQIDGAVHASFADYGEQPGDGRPSVSRELASAQITAATVSFLGRLAGSLASG